MISMRAMKPLCSGINVSTNAGSNARTSPDLPNQQKRLTRRSRWNCRSLEFRQGLDTYRPDFVAERSQDILVIDAIGQHRPPPWISEAIRAENYTYQTWSRGDIDPIRLKNCKDLLRYAGTEVRLGDRIRLLSALEDQGSLTFSECLQMMRESQPICALANMILARFIEIDLDTALLGPDTSVRKFSR